MIRNDKQVTFSEEDRIRLIVNQYSDGEMRKNKTLHKKKNQRRNFLMFALLALGFVIAYLFNQVDYIYIASSIFIVFMVFLIFLFYFLDKRNSPIVGSKHYIEMEILEKLPIESVSEMDSSSGSYDIRFYPIKGKDTTSGHNSTCYITRNEYKKFKVGEKIRINVKGECL